MADHDVNSSLTLSIICGNLFDDGVGNFDSGVGNFDDGGEFAELAVAQTGTVSLDLSLSSAVDLLSRLSRTVTLNVTTSDILYNFLASTRAITLDTSVTLLSSGFADTNTALTLDMSVSSTKDLLAYSTRAIALDLSARLGTYCWADIGEAEDAGIYTDVAPVEADPFSDVGYEP